MLTTPAFFTRFIANIEQETVMVAGAGVSGRASALVLAERGANVILADANVAAAVDVATSPAALAAPGDIKAINTDRAQNLLEQVSLVVTSPGWRPDTPLLVAAQRQALPVIGDVELAWLLDQAGCFGTPHRWLAITGTNGKTTTTSMVESIIKHAGLAACAVGNIGTPVFEALADGADKEVFVAELSSFQLHWSDSFTPEAGVLLNVAEDHLDWHGGLEAYASDKARVLRGKIAVVGFDDPLAHRVAQRYLANAETTAVAFGLRDPDAYPTATAVGLREGVITLRKGYGPDATYHPIVEAAKVRPAGPAGLLDAAAAAALTITTCDVDPAVVGEALAQFTVAAHRGQVVHHADGVMWVDNSKATNPHAAEQALAGYDSVVWIAGGQLKGASVRELVAQHFDRLRAVAVMGVDRAAIVQALMEAQQQEGRDSSQALPMLSIVSTDPEEAMRQAVSFAADHARPGDAVLLAPAAASLDMFTGMAQRGNIFAQLAHSVE